MVTLSRYNTNKSGGWDAVYLLYTREDDASGYSGVRFYSVKLSRLEFQ